MKALLRGEMPIFLDLIDGGARSWRQISTCGMLNKTLLEDVGWVDNSETRNRKSES